VGIESVIKEMEVRTQRGGRLSVSFPQWLVLLLVLLVVGGIGTNTLAIRTLQQLYTNHTDTLDQLTGAIRMLQQDSMRTRTILEMKFPRTARQVEDALEGEER